MDLTFLGSGGWIPTSNRETCSVLVRDQSRALLIDAGTGVRRLVDRPELLYGLEELSVALTHFHLDHVVGLAYLPAIADRLHPSIWAPGKLLYRGPTEEILHRLLGRPFFARSLQTFVTSVEEFREGSQHVAGFEVATRIQRWHCDPTLALRINCQLTYCTDTAFDPLNAKFAEGSGILCHEAWYSKARTDDDSHTAAGEAGLIAREASVAQLVLIHINPRLRSDEELLRFARAEFGDTILASDGLALRL
jgi:ribonuclease BN (tRNA processing enzyme)